MLSRHILVAFVTISFAVACNDEPTSPPFPSEETPITVGSGTQNSQGGTSMETQSSSSVTTLSNGWFSNTITARVFNGQNPSPGQTVTFTVISGGGSVSPATAITDADGVATTTLSYPPNIENVVDATGPNDLRTRTTIATYVNYAGIIRGVGTQQLTGAKGATLSEPVVVQVVDPNGEPLQGQRLRFELLDGGSVSPNEAVTDANGRASVSWTLRATFGLNRMKVTGENLVPHYVFAVGN